MLVVVVSVSFLGGKCMSTAADWVSSCQSGTRMEVLARSHCSQSLQRDERKARSPLPARAGSKKCSSSRDLDIILIDILEPRHRAIFKPIHQFSLPNQTPPFCLHRCPLPPRCLLLWYQSQGQEVFSGHRLRPSTKSEAAPRSLGALSDVAHGWVGHLG